MEAAYQRSATTKRHTEANSSKISAEKRRLIQLITSLILFCIVFFGRGVFPKFEGTLNGIINKDISFYEAFENIGVEAGNKDGLTSILSSLLAGNNMGNTEPEVPDESFATSEYDLIKIAPLSQSQQRGLLYYREHGFRDYSRQQQEITESPKPEIVTAVAQTYNENGELLPKNVSYQQYELGLDKTATPVFGQVTSNFEYRISPISGQREFHLAMDIAASKGTPISAFADGVVRYIGESDEFGLYLMIDHDNGVASFYAHCSKLLVHKGKKVMCGETVALVGDTGNATGYHLHFTIEKDNIRLNPAYYVDPEAQY